MSRGIADALAWVAARPADRESASMDEALALSAARLLAAEVERLHVELDARATKQEVQELLDWRGRVLAAAPGIVKCSNAAGCRERDYAWAGCCMVRAAFIELGLLEAGEPAEQADDDGA
jgi:hypothetical protein